MYIISLIILNYVGFEILEILRDPAQQSEESSFLGFLSTIGIWLWISSAAISIFTVFIHNVYDKNNAKELLILTGLFSLLLAVDDFFMIHDRYINEYLCYFIYVVLIGFMILRYFKIIISNGGIAFLLACTFLGLSVFTDLIQGYRYVLSIEYEDTQVVEEGFKFMGAATWLYFNGRIASFTLNSKTEKQKQG